MAERATVEADRTAAAVVEVPVRRGIDRPMAWQSSAMRSSTCSAG